MNNQDYLSNSFGNHPFFIRSDLLSKFASSSYITSRNNKLSFLYRDVWFDVFKYFYKLTEEISNCNTKIKIENGAVKFDISIINELDSLKKLVELLIPWRKGPWQINNFLIDSEWRSDIKYSDIESIKHLIKHKRIADIGGGNGYYAIRALLDMAQSAVVFDPSEKFFFQFELFQKFFQNPMLQYEIGGYSEAVKSGVKFDVVFCLGVFYHQKNPFELIEACNETLLNKGTLFLETMIIDDDKNHFFIPSNRYAKARNVYFLPSINALSSILKRVGFNNIEVVSQRVTSFEEQRKTIHMPYESLEDFIDKDNDLKTIEGYDRPKRALLIARKN